MTPSFDVSKNWVVLAPGGSSASDRAVKKAAEDIARCVGLLRGEGSAPAEISDASSASPPESAAVIVLNRGGGSREKNGYSWRASSSRVEIYGESGKGLCAGVYDFLSALGISWPAPDFASPPGGTGETLPEAREDGLYTLKSSSVHEPSPGAGGPGENGAAREAALRFVVPEKRFPRSAEKRASLLAWAARNKYDSLVFSFRFWRSAKRAKIMRALKKEAEDFALEIESGGAELSLLMPRRLYFLRRELFRMEGGRRLKKIHFCTTNPETIKIIKAESRKLFLSAPGTKVFHLWPDSGEEKTWCSCPSCRAFSRPEQYRIAVNAAADVLAELDRDAFVSIMETPSEAQGESSVRLRPNVLSIGRPWPPSAQFAVTRQ